MKKLIQLVFGDVRNVACVLVALALAAAVARLLPAAAGWVLVAALFAGAAWQAGA
jgi:hypothetical protein